MHTAGFKGRNYQVKGSHVFLPVFEIYFLGFFRKHLHSQGYFTRLLESRCSAVCSEIVAQPLAVRAESVAFLALS